MCMYTAMRCGCETWKLTKSKEDIREQKIMQRSVLGITKRYDKINMGMLIHQD